jgi:acid phosphatase
LKKQVVLAAVMLCCAFAAEDLAAQQSVPQKVVAQKTVRMSAYAPAERIPNLDDLKRELKRYQACTCECGCYAKDLDRQADRAITFLRWRAGHREPAEKLALVLDIDETTLSNWEQMVKAGFAYDKTANDQWTESARAPAIPGTLRVYQEAQRLGVSVFFLTGRPEAQRAATEQNLKSQGFQNWTQLILRSPAEASATAVAYKSAERGTIVAQGYKIVLNIGDQWSDLKGTPEAEFSVKYPDPFYFLK